MGAHLHLACWICGAVEEHDVYKTQEVIFFLPLFSDCLPRLFVFSLGANVNDECGILQSCQFPGMPLLSLCQRPSLLDLELSGRAWWPYHRDLIPLGMCE